MPVPGEGDEREQLRPGIVSRRGCKMLARPESQMHHRALSSPYSRDPLVTIFNLIKKEQNASASQVHARVLQCISLLYNSTFDSEVQRARELG